MATTFNGTKLTSPTDRAAGPGDAGSVKCLAFYYDILAALVINDLIRSPELPSGATVLDVTLTTVDLDTNGAPAVTIDVGYGDDPDYFIAASTVGQAGGVARKSALTAKPLVLTAADTIDILIKAAPATSVTTGRISMEVYYLPPNAG